MILTTEAEDSSLLDEEIASIARQLREMRHDLEDFQASLAAGDLEEAREAGKAVSSIKQWIRLAIEAEMLLATRRRNSAGIARGGYALDLDAARREIAARLDRLRRAGCPEGVS
jgi:hypothetical protein